MMKHNIIYLCTYLDEELSDKFSLKYAPAGLKKKQCMIRALASHHVEIVFVSVFTRILCKVFHGFTCIKNNIKVHVPWFTTIPFFNYLFNPWFVFFKIVILNKKAKIDFLILYNCVYENVIPAFLAKILLGLRVIVQYEDGWIIENHGFKNILFAFSHKLAYRISDGLIANSKNFLKLFPKKKYLLFRGSASHLSGITTSISESRTKERLNFVFASSIDKIRGARILSDFMLLTEDSKLINQIEITITGAAKDKTDEYLKMALKKYVGKDGAARYYGFVTEEKLEEIYNNTDVFLSLQDPSCSFSRFCFPSKLFEYYFYNRPIISTRISDIEDVFTNLILIDFGVVSLTEAIKMCVDNFDELVVRNKNNRQFIEDNFSDRQNQKIMDSFLETFC